MHKGKSPACIGILNFQINRVYELKNFKVLEDSKEFPSGTGHPYKISLHSGSKFVHSEQDILPITFNFKKLSELESLPLDDKFCNNS